MRQQQPHTRTRWLTQQQAADELGVSVRTLRRMIAEGDLPGYRAGARLIRVKQSDIDALFRRIPAAR